MHREIQIRRGSSMVKWPCLLWLNCEIRTRCGWYCSGGDLFL